MIGSGCRGRSGMAPSAGHRAVGRKNRTSVAADRRLKRQAARLPGRRAGIFLRTPHFQRPRGHGLRAQHVGPPRRNAGRGRRSRIPVSNSTEPGASRTGSSAPAAVTLDHRPRPRGLRQAGRPDPRPVRAVALPGGGVAGDATGPRGLCPEGEDRSAGRLATARLRHRGHSR
jgi:hypothetical protein